MLNSNSVNPVNEVRVAQPKGEDVPIAAKIYNILEASGILKDTSRIVKAKLFGDDEKCSVSPSIGICTDTRLDSALGYIHKELSEAYQLLQFINERLG